MKSEAQRIPDLDRKGLRDFALVTGAIISGLFGILMPWFFDLAWPMWPWVVAAILIIIGLTVPMALQPVYKIWMRFGLALNKVTTPVILGLVFFLVITPTGLIRRLVSDDSMARKLDESDSYRIKSKKSSPKNLEKPY
jgi:hypothetical protein